MTDKSLDDKLKEAEIAKLQSEEELVRKQINARWYSGQSLTRITATVLTLGAVYGVLDQWILKDVRDLESNKVQLKADLATLDLEKVGKERESIQTTIDSLKNKARLDSIAIDSTRAEAKRESVKAQRRLAKANKQVADLNLKGKEIAATLGALGALAGANFPGLDDPAVSEKAAKQYRMIIDKGYFDSQLNKTGKGIEHQFDVRVVKGDTVIYDGATGLTWQGGSKFEKKRWEDAKAYVNTLSYAGGGWRLPTLGEAMSLMEPGENGALQHRWAL